MRRRFMRIFSCGLLAGMLLAMAGSYVPMSFAYAQGAYQEEFTKEEALEEDPKIQESEQGMASPLAETEGLEEPMTEETVCQTSEAQQTQEGQQKQETQHVQGDCQAQTTKESIQSEAESDHITAKLYQIMPVSIVNCELLVDGKAMEVGAQAGESITFTVRVPFWHQLVVLSVVDEGDQRVPLEQMDETHYTFVMPQQNVKVYALAKLKDFGIQLMASQSSKVTTSNFSHDDYTSNPNGTTIHAEYLELDGKMAICTQHLATAPGVGMVYSLKDTYTAENKKNELMRKVLYYGYLGPGDLHLATYQVTHVAASVANGYPDSAWSLGAQFIAALASYAAPPAGFNVYIYGNNTGYQELALWEYQTRAYIQIQKNFSGGSLANYNPDKSKAIYGIYTDAACTKLYQSPYMTANTGRYSILSTGKSVVIIADPGTYYVKEITAPENYDLDTRTYTVKATTASSATAPVMVTSTDVFNDKRYIQIEKRFNNGTQIFYDPNKSKAIYGVYTDAACTKLYQSPYMTANTGRYSIQSTGKTILITVEAGTYYVKEITAPEDFELDPTIYKVVAQTKNTSTTPVIVQSVEAYKPVRYMQIEKVFEGGGLSDYDPGKSKAIYGVYTDAACTKLYQSPYMAANTGRYSIQANGKSILIYTEPGIYYVQEIIAPEGYALDPEIYVVDVRNAKTAGTPVMVHSEEPLKSGLSLQKVSSWPELTKDHPCYDLSGAVYGVYATRQDAEASGPCLSTLTTDAAGLSNSCVLDAGTYYVKELTAPEGFALDERMYSVEITVSNNTKLLMEDAPYYQKAFNLVKAAADDASEKGRYALQGARFRVDYYAGYFTETVAKTLTATRSWTFETDDEGQICFDAGHQVEGDDFYMGDQQVFLPLGTYVIEEIQAPIGYDIKDACFKDEKGHVLSACERYTFQIHGQDVASDTCIEQLRVYDHYAYGEFDFTKRAASDGKAMSGIPFKLTNVSEQTYLIVVTDDQGYYSSAADDHVPPLLYGDYLLEEQRCGANADKAMLTVPFTVDENQKHVALGDLYNEDLYIRTSARDQKTGSHHSSATKDTQIIDCVNYTGLEPEKTYRMVAALMDADTGAAVVDDKKHPICSERSFSPQEKTGSIEMTLSFDASGFEGRRVVVFESLYEGDILLCKHQDLQDMDQTIYFVKIYTTARDSVSQSHEACIKDEIQIIDSVQYVNLIPGETYTIEGVLMDRETRAAVTDANGQKITGKKSFVADKTSGIAEVTFDLKTESLKGKALVVFETMYHENQLVAAHQDLSDEYQTIYIPKKDTPPEPETEKVVTNTPKTGESWSGYMILLALLVMSAGMIAASIYTWFWQKHHPS